jgi:hypothetical protein
MHSYTRKIISLFETSLTLELKEKKIEDEQPELHSHLNVPGSGTSSGFHL